MVKKFCNMKNYGREKWCGDKFPQAIEGKKSHKEEHHSLSITCLSYGLINLSLF